MRKFITAPTILFRRGVQNTGDFLILSVASRLRTTRPYSYLAASALLVLFTYLAWSGFLDGPAAWWFLLAILGAAIVFAVLGHAILAFLVWLAPLYANLARLQLLGVRGEPIPLLFELWFAGGLALLLAGSWASRKYGLLGPARTWDATPKGRAIRGALLGLIAGTASFLPFALLFTSFLWSPALRGELVDASFQRITPEALIGVVIPIALLAGSLLGAAIGALASLAYARMGSLSWVDRGALSGVVLLVAGSLSSGLDISSTFFLGPPLWLAFGLLHSRLHESDLAAGLMPPAQGVSSPQ